MPSELILALGAVPSYYLRTTTYVRQGRGSRGSARPARRRSWRSSGGCSSCTGTRRSTTSRSCSNAAAARSTARRRPSSSRRSTPGPATSRSSTSATRGRCRTCRDHAVVEIPARIDRDGAHPLPLAPLAPEMRGLVQAMKAYEELTIEAAMSGDRGIALKALLRTRSCPTCLPRRHSLPRSSTRTARCSPASSRPEPASRPASGLPATRRGVRRPRGRARRGGRGRGRSAAGPTWTGSTPRPGCR